jgi:hypothetical protein
MTTARPLIVLPPTLAPLVNEKRWMGWKWVETKDGRTKPPFQGRWPSRFANSKDPKTWCDLTVCMQAYVENKVDGIGFALLDSNIAAIDIDDCRDPQTGKLHPWAANVVARSGSYAEVTPSNQGIRVLGLATGGKLHRKFSVVDGVSCELYRGAERYITITGQQIGAATVLVNIDTLLDELRTELERAKKEPSKRTNGTGTVADSRKHDLDSLIKDGCGTDFGGDRSRATWYVIHQLIKQGKGDDEIVGVLLDPPTESRRIRSTNRGPKNTRASRSRKRGRAAPIPTPRSSAWLSYRRCSTSMSARKRPSGLTCAPRFSIASCKPSATSSASTQTTASRGTPFHSRSPSRGPSPSTVPHYSTKLRKRSARTSLWKSTPAMPVRCGLSIATCSISS